MCWVVLVGGFGRVGLLDALFAPTRHHFHNQFRSIESARSLARASALGRAFRLEIESSKGFQANMRQQKKHKLSSDTDRVSLVLCTRGAYDKRHLTRINQEHVLLATPTHTRSNKCPCAKRLSSLWKFALLPFCLGASVLARERDLLHQCLTTCSRRRVGCTFASLTDANQLVFAGISLLQLTPQEQ